MNQTSFNTVLYNSSGLHPQDSQVFKLRNTQLLAEALRVSGFDTTFLHAVDSFLSINGSSI